MTIKDADVYYSGVDFDDPDWDFPQEVSFEVRGRMILGFRQLDAARWGASPLYIIEFAGGDENTARRALYGDGAGGAVLTAKLARKRRGKVDRPVLSEVSLVGGNGAVSRNAGAIGLYTRPVHGAGVYSHWLDTGSVIR